MCRLIWVLTGFTCNHVGNAVPQLNFHASPWKLFLCDLLEAVNTGNDMYKLKSWSCWTRICPAFANIVDLDQLASAEANWSGSALFVIKYVNLYQQPGSSILIGCTLEVGMTSKFIQRDKSLAYRLILTHYMFLNWYPCNCKNKILFKPTFFSWRNKKSCLEECMQSCLEFSLW